MSDPKKILQGYETRKRIYHFIRMFWETEKKPPCIRDIQDGAKISSTSIVAHHLAILKREGIVSFDTNSNRTLVLIGTEVILPECDTRYV